jgi:trypsin
VISATCEELFRIRKLKTTLAVKDFILKKFHVFFRSRNTRLQVRYNTLKHTTGPTIDVKKAIAHESYNPRTVDNDIAILILSSPFENGTNARAIEILQNSDPHPGSTVTVSGWGVASPPPNGDISEILQITNLNVVQRSTCRNIWSGYITRNMICAIDPTRSSCFVSITQKNFYFLI